MATPLVGRVNQKQRTRTAIVEAARALLTSGDELSMPTIARAALVSEATAYRYFPDLASLLIEAFTAVWSNPAEAMAPIEANRDPVDRIAFAAEVLLREVLAHQSAIRAVMAAALTKPTGAAMRPGRRFVLIDAALAPLTRALAETESETEPGSGPDPLEQLRRSLAIVVSAEALFTLTDLYGLDAADAVDSVINTARLITAAAIGTLLTSAPTAAATVAPPKPRR